MSTEVITCQWRWESGDMQTRLSCDKDAIYKVGRPHESLVRRYVCADHLTHALRSMGRDSVVFDLVTWLIVDPQSVSMIYAPRLEFRWWI